MKAIESIAGEPDKLSAPPGARHQPMSHRLGVLRNDIQIDDMKIYANIRNPFARLVSIYFYRLEHGKARAKSFKEFFYKFYGVSKRTPNGPIDKMILEHRKVPSNLTIVKLEKASDVWPRIIKRHFGKQVELPTVNTSTHNDPLSYFDKEMRSIVKKLDKWVIRNYYPHLRNV